MRELDELIAAGWGEVPQDRIPADWRTRKAPKYSATPEHREHVKAGMRRVFERRQAKRKP